MNLFNKSRKYFLNLLPFLLIIYFIGIRSYFLAAQFSFKFADFKPTVATEKSIDQAHNVETKKSSDSTKTLIKNFLCFYGEFLTPSFFEFAFFLFILSNIFLIERRLRLSYPTNPYPARAPPSIC